MSHHYQNLDFSLPPVSQLLAGVIYAESATKNWGGGENAEEKYAIGATFLNETYYANLKWTPGKKCHNESFGVGTLISAIKMNAQAYHKSGWNSVMVGDLLKNSGQLSKLSPDEIAHLKLSVAAAAALPNYIPPPITVSPVGTSSPRTVPVAIISLGGKIPVCFNKASNSPPNSSRMVRIGQLGPTTFYGFLPGRERE